MSKTQCKTTNEEYERAFQEVALFLFEQYKKSKQDKEAKKDDAA